MRRGCGNSAIAAASLIAAALTVSPAPAVACSAQTSGDVALGGINGAPCLDVLDGALGTVTVGGSVAASIGAPITYFYSVGSAQGFSVIRQTADTTNSTLDEIITTSPVNIGGNLLSINPQADILIQNIANGNRFATISRIVNNAEYRGDTFLFNYSMILDVNSVFVSNFVNNSYIYFTMNAIDNFGTISNLYNNGYMIADLSAYQGVSFPGSAVRNLGVIGTLYNQGLMSAPRPILNGGRIETFINTGQIVGTGGYDVGNLWIIVNFHNASTLRLSDNLPENYFVIIRGVNDFGRLAWVTGGTNATPLMRFGVSPYSTGLAAGTYTAVLSNITSAEIDTTTRSGTINRFAWTLEDPDQDNSWDLILRWLGSDPANTLAALQSSSGAVRSVLSQRAAATTFALDYDCSVFDQHGVCVSVGARNTQMGNTYADSGETAGILTAAYRVTPEFRLGGFIDQNLVAQSPVGVDPKNTQPMLGAFAVYQENPNFTGFTVRAALAYQEGDLRITRPEIADTEAGTGRARTSALAFGGEVAYGVPLDGTWVAQPYAGLRRSNSQRRGYAESDAVDFPLTYNRFGQQVTSATTGLRMRGAITPEFSLTFGAGIEHDLDSKLDRYAGTSAISGLETFSINASQQQNETRAVGSAGMRYMVASNQTIAFDASVRQLPYGNDPSLTTMLRYAIGF